MSIFFTRAVVTSCSIRAISASRTLAPEAGEPVVTAAFVVEFGVRPFGSLLDQTRPQHSLDRPVQRPRPHRDRPVSQDPDLAHDRVAMLVPRGQGQQDVQLRNREG